MKLVAWRGALALALATALAAAPADSPAADGKAKSSKKAKSAPAKDSAKSSPKTAATPSPSATPDAPKSIQALIDAAQPGAVVNVPKGVFAEALKIAKPLTLRGAGADATTIKILSNDPAIAVEGVKRQGDQGGVTIENLAVVWSPASTTPPLAKPGAIYFTKSDGAIRGCSFQPLQKPAETPFAAGAAGGSNVDFIQDQSRGFAYAFIFTEGSRGSVRECELVGADHSAVTIHPGCEAKIEGNILAKCGYSAVRNTGGIMDMTGNLVIGNARAGVYLGNQAAHGKIANNLFVNNGSAIWAFAESDAAIENNVLTQSKSAAITILPSCKLAIRRNAIADNPVGVLQKADPGKGAGAAGAKLEGNIYWKNQADAQGLPADSPAVVAEEFFSKPPRGDFSLRPGTASPALGEAPPGLLDAKPLQALWSKWSKTPEPQP